MGIACVNGEAGLDAAERIRSQKKSWLPSVRVSVPSSLMAGNAWPPKTSRRPRPEKFGTRSVVATGCCERLNAHRMVSRILARRVPFRQFAQVRQDDVVVSLDVLEVA